MNYYNENDPSAAAWLRGLIAEGLIPPGDVDTRSIIDVRPHEIAHYTQQHFFAGIGGWSLALRLAGWPDSRPVRTGSCPCQPFSIAGKGLGKKDPRHLWPFFRDLITFGDSTVTFGEQVASKDGRNWLAGVRLDLEGLGYAVGAADLCAAGIGAPHLRQRLYWLADAKDPDGRAELKIVGDATREGSSGHPDGSGEHGGVANPDGGHASAEWEQRGGEQRLLEGDRVGGFWSQSRWIACRDGKHRRVPVEPAIFPLADGLPYKLARRGSIRPALLKGAGNAIVPEITAEFIMAYLEIEQLTQ